MCNRSTAGTKRGTIVTMPNARAHLGSPQLLEMIGDDTCPHAVTSSPPPHLHWRLLLSHRSRLRSLRLHPRWRLTPCRLLLQVSRAVSSAGLWLASASSRKVRF